MSVPISDEHNEHGPAGEFYRPETQAYKGIFIPDLPHPVIDVVTPPLEAMPDKDTTGLGYFRAVAESAVASTELPNVTVVKAKSTHGADLAIPAHAAVKSKGEEALDEIESALDLTSLFTTDRQGMFVNINLEPGLFADKVIGDVEVLGGLYGSNNSGEGRTVVLDTSSPNIAKQMHLGHLRSTVIGEALSRILKFNGYNTLRDNHVGDWGTQFGLLGEAVERWGQTVPELRDEDPARQVTGLLELYVRINKEIAAEKAASEDGTSELENSGREWFVGLEAGDQDALEFWRWASDISMLEFKEIYDALGVEFEYVLGESAYEESNASVIEAFKQKGITFVDDKGVVKVTPSTRRSDALGIQKPDGSSLYGTRDLATIAARMNWFEPSKILYVVGSEQSEYFRNLFDAYQQFDDQTPELQHVGFGEVVLPNGKMSTRAGNVVFLKDVLNMYQEAALAKVLDNMDRRGIEVSNEEVVDLARKVAVGAMIYFDLQGAADRKIVYEPEKAVSFEGNTGPSLQYVVARINALFNKDHAEDTLERGSLSIETLPDNAYELDLVKKIADFPDVVVKAADKYEPSIIASYLNELAGSFNRFYVERPILRETDTRVKNTRLRLAAAARQVMSNGLVLLNIPTPESM